MIKACVNPTETVHGTWRLFPVFISPIVWTMCEHLNYESAYFKQLHNQQLCHTLVTYISILGWILDPLLFLLYIDDFYNVSNSALDFIFFAEDTNIFFSRNDPNKLMEFVNDELKKLLSWFQANKLFINIKKIKFYSF